MALQRLRIPECFTAMEEDAVQEFFFDRPCKKAATLVFISLIFGMFGLMPLRKLNGD